MSVLDNRTIQFELWHECNNDCSFCYLHEGNRFTPDEMKIHAIERSINKISDLSIFGENGFNCIGFIGGEFFQGQLKDIKVHEKFYELFKKVADLYNKKIIKSVWIPATLTIGKQEDLYKILNFFDNYDDVWIITSWDSIGRFKTKKMEDNWKFHLKKLKKEFKGIKINVTTILTEDLITKYLNDEISFKKMMEEFDITFFFKQAGCIENLADTESSFENFRESKRRSNLIQPHFFPKRSQFLDFLLKFKNTESENMWDRLFNIRYRANELDRNFNDGSSLKLKRFKMKKAEDDSKGLVMSCGHRIVYSAYIDCDNCVLCDKMSLTDDE